eukprot:1207315-Pyramimonas_sp.AAC.1
MEQSEGSPRKKSKNLLTVRTEMCGVSVRKAVRKREGKRKKNLYLTRTLKESTEELELERRRQH